MGDLMALVIASSSLALANERINCARCNKPLSKPRAFTRYRLSGIDHLCSSCAEAERYNQDETQQILPPKSTPSPAETEEHRNLRAKRKKGRKSRRSSRR